MSISSNNSELRDEVSKLYWKFSSEWRRYSDQYTLLKDLENQNKKISNIANSSLPNKKIENSSFVKRHVRIKKKANAILYKVNELRKYTFPEIKRDLIEFFTLLKEGKKELRISLVEEQKARKFSKKEKLIHKEWVKRIEYLRRPLSNDAIKKQQLIPKQLYSYPVPLRNNGNSCYIISILQLCSNIPELFDFFIRREEMNKEIRDVFKAYAKAQRVRIGTSNPITELDYLAIAQKASGEFSNGGAENQQDVEELFQYMLGKFDKKEIEAGNPFAVSIKTKDCFDLTPIQEYNMEEFDKGGWKERSSEVSFIVKIPIGKQGSSLEEMFDKEFNRTDIDPNEGTINRHGKKLQKKAEYSRFATLPKMFMASFKRFDYDVQTFTRHKLHQMIAMGTEFLLPRRFLKQGEKSGLYEIAGFISHEGRHASHGHYVAHLNLGDKGWARCDDHRITLNISQREIEKALSRCYIPVFRLVKEVSDEDYEKESNRIQKVINRRRKEIKGEILEDKIEEIEEELPVLQSFLEKPAVYFSYLSKGIQEYLLNKIVKECGELKEVSSFSSEEQEEDTEVIEVMYKGELKELKVKHLEKIKSRKIIERHIALLTKKKEKLQQQLTPPLTKIDDPLSNGIKKPNNTKWKVQNKQSTARKTPPKKIRIRRDRTENKGIIGKMMHVLSSIVHYFLLVFSFRRARN